MVVVCVRLAGIARAPYPSRRRLFVSPVSVGRCLRVSVATLWHRPTCTQLASPQCCERGGGSVVCAARRLRRISSSSQCAGLSCWPPSWLEGVFISKALPSASSLIVVVVTKRPSPTDAPKKDARPAVGAGLACSLGVDFSYAHTFATNLQLFGLILE
jgi:hypothetical protein